MSTPNPASVRTPQRPVDGDHALRIGWTFGSILRDAARDRAIATDDVVVLVDDEGRYLDAIRITAPSGTYLVSIEKET